MTDTRVGVDVGGTFTDVALVHDGRLTTAKVPTTDDQSVGVMAGIEKACDEAGIDPDAIGSFTHAMTVSVNALLEEDGATTALVTTAGFRDVLEIGRQDRPALYDLHAEKPDPLVPRRRRYEVVERATTEGIETPVAPADARAVAAAIADADEDVEAVAVSLLHAYAHPDNEATVARVLREELDVPVSVSHEVLGEFREYERTSTTVVDAYVTPAIDRYVGNLTERAAAAGVPEPRIMQANGGIASADAVRERAVTTAMSGPAAGVVGAGALGIPFDDLVTFDMGGTSSDVSLVRDGEAERTTEAEISGRPVGVPMVDVETVGAGGGSVAWVDGGGALRVGPRSAGADPGPACYGNGGTEPTVTDANVVLGYIGSGSALGGELELDVTAARDACARIAREADLDGPLAAARGIYRVANANMARAIRSVTVERGHDPRNFALAAFGGAGPMHAAALAEDLGMTDVLVPYAGGVLSASGLLAAGEKHDAVRTRREALAAVDADAVADALAELAADVRARAVGDPPVEFAADCRYAGQSFELTVPVEGPAFDPEATAERFEAAHEATYGYRMDDPVELVNLRATATGEATPVDPGYVGGESVAAARTGTRTAHFGESDDDSERSAPGRETPVYDRDAFPVDGVVEGPAVLEQAETTVVVPPDWTGTVLADGTLHMALGAEAGEQGGAGDV
ncbi:hydantoinase/oxoprolinase family protein [Haloparvum sedimenti]|uniref:hydantoinase/oxoprolinase family protein n=1 Tax=Haloparvum sedimenti TaxID=1678448 RepID=UPI00071E78FA|nr:hydantoinase/oxoprolinase family protein [Haloparvum sedimenti]